MFKYLETLGRGGNGETLLFEDETTNMKFAIKKYSPYNLEYLEEDYIRFVEEIKILFRLSHPNIVRVYNYYLYPASKTGYLQMEYVKGVTIDEFELVEGSGWDEIFVSLIKAFAYLEENGVLHRDVRPANIMIDDKGIVKIIDFGFGKVLGNTADEKASVVLNWPVTILPHELQLDEIYNHQTEIFFVGKLFSKLPFKGNNENFKYHSILTRMCELSPDNRYRSFSEIASDLTKDTLEKFDFSEEQKRIYLEFADYLFNQILFFKDKFEFENDLSLIIRNLQNIVRTNKLECIIQNNALLIQCFVSSGFSYDARKIIPYEIVNKFYLFLLNIDAERQKLVIENIHNRLKTVEVTIDLADIPF